jgi:hypothetical protein
MRIVNILIILLLSTCVVSGADYDLAKKLASLNSEQRVVLYQYNTLLTYAPEKADSFWQVRAIKGISIEEAQALGHELGTNSELVYEVKQPSRIQTLRGLFTASRLLYGAAGLILAYALVQLIANFWSRIIVLLAPVLRILFSPILLTLELLVAASAGIYFGVQIEDTFLRTLLLHIAILLIWGQLTALFTREYYIKQYWELVFNSFDDGKPIRDSFFRIFIPAFIVTLLLVWIISQCDDRWYHYEIVLPAMVTICTFPLVRMLEPVLSRLIYPFPCNVSNYDRQRANAVVIGVIVWSIPGLFTPALMVLSIVLAMVFIGLSYKRVYTTGIKNYVYLQVVSFSFLLALVFAGTQRELTWLTWAGPGFIFLYVLIKYWEWPAMLGVQWKKHRAVGLLGMALLIWGIASLLRILPLWFPDIF